MLGMPGTWVGIAGTVCLAASFAQTALSESGAPRPPSPSGNLALVRDVAAAQKGDRLGKAALPAARTTVTTIELVGSGQATLVLRDRDGNVLYRFDPRTNSTFVAKDSELPVITYKDQADPSLVQPSVAPKEDQEGATEAPKRKGLPVGCFGALSPLVRSEASRTPSLCLAGLDLALDPTLRALPRA